MSETPVFESARILIGSAKDMSAKDSGFYFLSPELLAKQPKEDYMSLCYEEVLVNLFNRMYCDFGLERTQEWFKQMIEFWDIVKK